MTLQTPILHHTIFTKSYSKQNQIRTKANPKPILKEHFKKSLEITKPNSKPYSIFSHQTCTMSTESTWMHVHDDKLHPYKSPPPQSPLSTQPKTLKMSLSPLSLLLLLSPLLTTAYIFNDDDPLIQQVTSRDNHENLFTEFKTKYNKSYANQDEDDYRFGVFVTNLRLAKRNQELDPTGHSQ